MQSMIGFSKDKKKLKVVSTKFGFGILMGVSCCIIAAASVFQSGQGFPRCFSHSTGYDPCFGYDRRS